MVQRKKEPPMLNTIKISTILLVLIFSLAFGSTMSFAWDHGSGTSRYHGGSGHHGYGGGGYHGTRGHGYYGSVNFGLGFNYWPYNYYYSNYYDAGVYVTSPIVETPEIIEQPTAITPVQINTSVEDDAFTINIPNSAGGYTGVLLKRSGKGFIGPQGEFYPIFPRVAQLKVMYGQ